MDVESLLRDALDVGRVPGEPSLGFEERVVRSLPAQRRRQSRFVPAFLGLAAALALAAVGVPWLLGGFPIEGPATESAEPSALEPSATPTLGPSASPESSITPAPPALDKHARAWGLEFDYPAGWQVADAPAVEAPKGMESYPPSWIVDRQVFGYVGTTIPRTVCTPAVVSESSADSSAWSLGTCYSEWSLGPGDVAIRVERSDIEGSDFVLDRVGMGTTITHVGGLPAYLGRSEGSAVPNYGHGPDPGPWMVASSFEDATGAEAVLVWYLPGNETTAPAGPPARTFYTPAPVLRIVAAVRGPNLAELEAQVGAVVGSMRYSPAVVPLPTDAAARAALAKSVLATTLGDPADGLPCFPRQEGVEKSAVIVDFGGDSNLNPRVVKLTKPLPVVCSVAIEPNVLEGWTLTLTVKWEAASDRKAGQWVSVLYAASDGHAWGGDNAGEGEFPYEKKL
jgi:hypothetical protein